MDGAIVLTRLAQYLAVCVVGGSSLFFVYGPAPEPGAGWPRRAVQLAAGLGVAGTVGWLMAQAAVLGAGPADAFNPAAVWSVASDTGFGRAALLRAALLTAALTLACAPLPGRARWAALAALGLAAAASFAWTGHGNTDEGWAGAVHLGADLAHLLSAAVWLGALFALCMLMTRLGPVGGARRAAEALNSFSRIGVAVVAILAASGFANSWFLVGPQGVPGLLTTPYGQILVAKLLLFVLMLGLAAANRYVHARRIVAATGLASEAAGLRSAIGSVVAEAAIGGVVLFLVSWLGTLAPPGHG